jgi:hypothetical protein
MYSPSSTPSREHEFSNLDMPLLEGIDLESQKRDCGLNAWFANYRMDENRWGENRMHLLYSTELTFEQSSPAKEIVRAQSEAVPSGLMTRSREKETDLKVAKLMLVQSSSMKSCWPVLHQGSRIIACDFEGNN